MSDVNESTVQTKPHTKHRNLHVCRCCFYIDISLFTQKLTSIVTMVTLVCDVTSILLFFSGLKVGLLYEYKVDSHFLYFHYLATFVSWSCWVLLVSRKGMGLYLSHYNMHIFKMISLLYCFRRYHNANLLYIQIILFARIICPIRIKFRSYKIFFILCL
jgi:hypothetical protein